MDLIKFPDGFHHLLGRAQKNFRLSPEDISDLTRTPLDYLDPLLDPLKDGSSPGLPFTNAEALCNLVKMTFATDYELAGVLEMLVIQPADPVMVKQLCFENMRIDSEKTVPRLKEVMHQAGLSEEKLAAWFNLDPVRVRIWLSGQARSFPVEEYERIQDLVRRVEPMAIETSRRMGYGKPDPASLPSTDAPLSIQFEAIEPSCPPGSNTRLSLGLVPFFRRVLDLAAWLVVALPLLGYLAYRGQLTLEKPPANTLGEIVQTVQSLPARVESLVRGKSAPVAMKEYLFDLGFYPGQGTADPATALGFDPAGNHLLKKVKKAGGRQVFGPYITDIEQSYRDGHGSYYLLYLVGEKGRDGLFLVSRGANRRLEIPGLPGEERTVHFLPVWPRFLTGGDDEVHLIYRRG